MHEPTSGADRPEPHPEAAPVPDGPDPDEPAGPGHSAERDLSAGPDLSAEPDLSGESGHADEHGHSDEYDHADEPGAAGPPPEEAAGPQPLGVPVTPTRHDEVDDRLARLGDVDHLAVGGHLPVYEDVHRGLRDTLASLDQQPGPRPAARNDLRS
ncbi:hypothetical protein ABZ840_27320 [Streptomyces sp. NPDC047117]|uniref:hypothetical protein n=1 Tax=Streptomyces sp. NPDC047117 TaxID=3155379 RepID=UPI00340AD5CD